MKNMEILAPAGSMETLCAALRSGANAVYAGGKRFSARNNAVNFDDSELVTAVRMCHKYGAKFYIAVNTIISDDEIQDFCEYIKFTALAGIDAYIVQDWGCAELIRKCVPDAVLHASTQMSVHTASGAEFLKENGWKRVVPARELDRDVLKKISDTGIETEIFVHGALCMSVSGQCYMSAVMGSRSANRGCCGQACRLPFSASGNKDFSALSLRDLSLIPEISELSEIADSLKIEGRMKRPEYVASAVNELKKAISGQTPDMNFLKGIFSRSGFTDGYFTGKRKNMFGKREKEDVISAKELIPKVHELYRFERKVYDISFHAEIKKNRPVKITASCGVSATAEGDIPENAVNRPTDLNLLKKQLSKLGDTVFSLNEITADIDDGLVVPVGKINELRRKVISELTEEIIKKNTPERTITDYSPIIAKKCYNTPEKLPIRTFCRNIEQAKASVDISEYIILDPSLSLSMPFLSELAEYREKIILSPPRFITDEEKIISSLKTIKEKFGIDRIMCHTPDCIAIGKKLGFILHGNFTLNIFNSFSAEYMKNIGLEDFIFSYEAKLQQINNIHTDIPAGAVIYGRFPLMLTRNCPIKNEIDCKNCTMKITDRTDREFPVLCSPHYVEILNSDCLYMYDRLSSFSNISFGAVILYDENAEQTKAVLSGKKPSVNITRGLYYRGI